MFVSDLIVDVWTAQGIEYVAANPGSTLRGLHESLANHAPNSGGPRVITAPSENIAVGLAHGYAKATGKPMAVMMHDVVGLLRGALNLYWAYLDRVPMVVVGGTGPVEVANRRDYIDWIHTANVQGTAVRDFVKWDDQPADVAGLVASLARAFEISIARPQGPTYLTVDVALQLDTTPDDFAGEQGAPRPTTPAMVDESALRDVAQLLSSADFPIFIAGYTGGDPGTVADLGALANVLGAGVWDTGVRFNLANGHPMNVTGSDAIREADVVVLLDVKDLGDTVFWDFQSQQGLPVRPGARIIDIGQHEAPISSWAQDYGPFIAAERRLSGDARSAVTQLGHLARALIDQQPELRDRVAQRTHRIRSHRARARESWAAAASDSVTSAAAMNISDLATVVWDAVRDHDWVLSAGTAKDWALRLWDVDEHHRHPGKALATATQSTIALGVALAHRGKGRVVVDLQPDGDLLYDPASLWVATNLELPLLVVMVNNRAYWTDWLHQIDVSQQRGRPVATSSVGMALDAPEVDFAGLARAFGWHAEGPISDARSLRPAVVEAAKHVATTGRPALVDALCNRI